MSLHVTMEHHYLNITSHTSKLFQSIIRLSARNFYLVILHGGKTRINYQAICIESKQNLLDVQNSFKYAFDEQEEQDSAEQD